MGHARQKDTLGSELDRPQLHVRFQEELLGVKRHLEHGSQMLGVGPRPDPHGKHQRVSLDGQLFLERRVKGLHHQPPIASFHQRRAFEIVAHK